MFLFISQFQAILSIGKGKRGHNTIERNNHWGSDGKGGGERGIYEIDNVKFIVLLNPEIYLVLKMV